MSCLYDPSHQGEERAEGRRIQRDGDVVCAVMSIECAQRSMAACARAVMGVLMNVEAMTLSTEMSPISICGFNIPDSGTTLRALTTTESKSTVAEITTAYPKTKCATRVVRKSA